MHNKTGRLMVKKGEAMPAEASFPARSFSTDRDPILKALDQVRLFAEARNIPLPNPRAFKLMEMLHHVEIVFGFFADEEYPPEDAVQTGRGRPSVPLLSISTVLGELERELKELSATEGDRISDRLTKCERAERRTVAAIAAMVIGAAVVFLAEYML